MRIIVRTVYGSKLQTARLTGAPLVIPAFSTLNEAILESTIVPHLPSPINKGMEIVPAYSPSGDIGDLKLQYITIGNRAHRPAVGADDVPYMSAIPHRASDSGLYGMIPFVVKPLTADLTPVQRQDYRLRRTMDIGGTMYAAYYARRVDFSTVEPETVLITVDEGIEIPSAFVPNINNLKPTAPTPVEVTLEQTNGTYLQVTSTVQFVLNDTEVQWLKEAMQLVYGDENLAQISEVDLCSGVEKTVTERIPLVPPYTSETAPGGPFTEAVAVQSCIIVSSYYPVTYTNDGLTITLELGAVEPLFGVEV
jgi:hypothetical protein